MRPCSLLFVAASVLAAPLTMLTYNTLSADDTFSAGWGAVGEIARRDVLVASNGTTVADAEAILLEARYQRVASLLHDIQHSHNVVFLQEVDVETSTRPSLLSAFSVSPPWSVACRAVTSYEQELLLVNTNDILVHANWSWSDKTGVLGCAARVRLVDHEASQPDVTLATIHMQAKAIRNPATINATLLSLLSSIDSTHADAGTAPWILGGDFNAHLPDVVRRLQSLDDAHTWRAITARPNTTRGDLRFTSQHENGFVAAYDGFLVRDYTRRPRDNSKVLAVGFMPKHLGNAIKYDDQGDLIVNGRAWGPANWANQSLSDHLAVSATLFASQQLRQSPSIVAWQWICRVVLGALGV